MPRSEPSLARTASLVFAVIAMVFGSLSLSALAQVTTLPPQPQLLTQFSCGPHLLTYEVFGSNGQRAKGIRCVKVKMWPPKNSGVPGQFDFAWYGEGDWGSGPYRHVGYAFNSPELPSISAADIFGNGEKFDAAYLSRLDHPSNNIRLKQVIGNWSTPDEIHLEGAWQEVWKRVKATSYQPLPKIATCGPHFYEYQAQSPDPSITDRGVRCVGKHFAGGVWFGSGKWGEKEYTHLGIHEWSPDGNGVPFQGGTGDAGDICDPAVGSFCSMTPAKGIQFTRQGSNIKVGGAWNEFWLAQEKFKISVLTINLKGVSDYPSCGTSVFWEDRYRRIGAWLKQTGNKPDIIPLQEAVGWMWCPTNPSLIKDYAALDFLLDEIRTATGEQYRIAYLTDSQVSGGRGDCGVHSPTAGGCKLYGNLALLYLPTRLRNALADPVGTGIAHDDENVTELHLRRSLPACNLALGREDVAGVIDGFPQLDKCNRPTPSGLTWVQRQGGSPHGSFDAAFSRFELISQPGNFIHLYNVHLDFSNYPAAISNVNSLVTSVENRFGTTPAGLLWAPILVGDFNITDDGIPGAFPDFRIAKWAPHPEVISVSIGRENIYPSKELAYFKNAEVLPVPNCYAGAPGGVPGGGGPIDLLWSDHCALFFSIESTP